MAVITGSLGASFALGMLPDILKSLPGPPLLWLGLFGSIGVVLVMVSTYLLHHRKGVGIVLYLLPTGPSWDTTRLRVMAEDARRKHATCFTVNVDELLHREHVTDRAAFAFRVMQARLAEEAEAGRSTVESASFYVTARLPDAYQLGQLLKFQVHDDVDVYAEDGEQNESGDGGDDASPVDGRRPARVRGALMGLSEERGRSMFPAVGLDSGLLREPDERDTQLLSGVVAGKPVWKPFESPDTPRRDTSSSDTPRPGTPGRIALVLRVSGKPMVYAALQAAREGTSSSYAFPGGRPAEENRCAGALVIDTKQANIPDKREVYEALIRHVGHHWKSTLDAWGTETGGEVRGLLFTDAPATIVLALGAVLGRNTKLVPHVSSAPANPGTPSGAVQGVAA